MNGISIVIIARGRKKLLKELIVSIERAQQEVTFPTEIVLVDSTQGNDRSAVEKMSREHGLSYYYQDITVSAKRNFGASHAKYDTVLFLDSDCIVTENILKNYAKILKKYPDAIGSCGPLEFVGEDTWFWKVIEKTPYTIFFSTAKWGETFTWAPTANFLVKKDVFLSVGGFDETFPKNPGGEDVDLGMRMCSTGGKMYSCPEALVYHSKTTWCSPKAMFRRVFHYGRGDLCLVERHPEKTCACLPRRFIMILYGMLLYLLMGIFLSPILLLGCLLTPVYEILMTAVLVNITQKYKRTSFLKQIVIQLLFLWNEAGFLQACVAFRKIRLRNRQLIHFKPQMDGMGYQYFLSSVVYGIFGGLTLLLFFIFL